GGTGDVFAGVCGAMLARGVKSFDAACAAAFLTGKTGDLAVKEFGEGLLATNLIDYIPKATK
ncbi:MAG: NAD(P)H-hydrate dehydratase, partial [Candidatus Aenigmatarchaeota archaeon]